MKNEHFGGVGGAEHPIDWMPRLPNYGPKQLNRNVMKEERVNVVQVYLRRVVRSFRNVCRWAPGLKRRGGIHSIRCEVVAKEM